MQQEPKPLPLDEPTPPPTIRLQRRTMIVWATEQVYRDVILSRTPPRLLESSDNIPLRGPLLVTFTGPITIQDLRTIEFPSILDEECTIAYPYTLTTAPKSSYRVFGAKYA